MTPNAPPNGNGNGRHLNNYRLFRPQAVEAYSTRHAGEPWTARTPFEGWIIGGLTVIAMAVGAAIFWGGR